MRQPQSCEARCLTPIRPPVVKALQLTWHSGKSPPARSPAVHVSSRLPRPPKPPKGANGRRAGDVDPLEIRDGRPCPGWEIGAAPEVSDGAPGRTRTSDARFRKLLRSV